MRCNRVTGATFVSVVREVTGVLPLLNRGDRSEWDDVDD